MRSRWNWMVIACAFLVRAVGAADLTVHVVDAHGVVVADAVVTVLPHAGNTLSAAAPPPSATKIIDQKGEAFIPYVEIFRPGDHVIFHNSDHTRHHVYSFAPARQFEFVLTPGESSNPLRLDQAGVVAVGCNIHDQMITYFFVSDAPWLERTGTDGRASIGPMPPGEFDVHVWHPQLRPGQPAPLEVVKIDAPGDAKDLNFKLSLLPDPRSPVDRERANY
jgi:plastocyanin